MIGLPARKMNIGSTGIWIFSCLGFSGGLPVTRNAESISEQFCLLLTNLKNALAVFYDYGQQKDIFSRTKCLYVTAYVVII